MATDLYWFTKREAADYLRVTPQTLDSYVRRGVVPRYKLEGLGQPRWKRGDLDRLMKRDRKVERSSDDNNAVCSAERVLGNANDSLSRGNPTQPEVVIA